MADEKIIWFKKKKYGWGWDPANAKGWLVILLYSLLSLIYPFIFDLESSSLAFILYLAVYIPIITMVLIYICYLKGEKPEWQWGDKK